MAFKFAVVISLLAVVGSGIARPQLGLTDAEALRRQLDGQDMFDPNPQYNYQYQVANDEEQVYIAANEIRDGDAVRGQYRYVDPTGSLITVTYTADVNGYQENREVQEGFITINQVAPITPVVSIAPVAPVTPVSPPSPQSQGELVAQIIAQLSPFIKDTVSSSLSSQESTQFAVQPIAPVQVATSTQEIFGTGGVSNIRVETPEYQFLTSLS